jgi:hypothetical protein
MKSPSLRCQEVQARAFADAISTLFDRIVITGTEIIRSDALWRLVGDDSIVIWGGGCSGDREDRSDEGRHSVGVDHEGFVAEVFEVRTNVPDGFLAAPPP